MLRRLESDLGRGIQEAELFLADTGPGSFTGVRVGVMLAKSFAFVQDVPVSGADAFDLIDANGPAVLPSKRGEHFVRIPGEPPYRTTELPDGGITGYGNGVEPSVPPHAARFAGLLDRLVPVSPMEFVPRYLIDPSISIPKKPFLRRPEAS